MDFFSQNINRLRTSKNLTQTELAEALHISHQAISKWEKGKSIPDTEMLTSIAKYFNTTIDELLHKEIHIYNKVYTAPTIDLPLEETEEVIPRTKSPLGVLFLIPMFAILSIIAFIPIIKRFLYSLTNYNPL